MENKISQGYFFANAFAADFRRKHVAYLWYTGYGCSYYLHQQYGTYHEFNNAVL